MSQLKDEFDLVPKDQGKKKATIRDRIPEAQISKGISPDKPSPSAYTEVQTPKGLPPKVEPKVEEKKEESVETPKTELPSIKE